MKAAEKKMKIKKNDINMKKTPKNKDNCPLKNFIFGSSRARYPQIKYSNYASLENKIMELIMFEISHYVSSYPF